MGRQRHSIQMRIILLSMAFTLLIALGICAASLTVLYQNTLRFTAQSIEYGLQVAASNLYRCVSEIDSFANWCTVDSTIRGYMLNNPSQKQLLDVYNTLLTKYSSQSTSRYISRVLITDGGQRTLQQGTSIAQSMAITPENLELLPGFSSDDSSVSWTILANDPLIINGHKEIIPVVRLLPSPTSDRHIHIYIAVLSSMITDTLQDCSLIEETDLFWVMGDQFWSVEGSDLLPPEEGATVEKLEEMPQHVSLFDSNTQLFRYNGRLTLAYPVGMHDLYIAKVLPLPSILSQLSSMLPPLLAALAALLLLGLLLGLLLRRMIATTVSSLQNQLKRIGDGDFSPNPAIEWDNEMGDIGRGINGLSRSISNLMEKRLEDERQKQDLEYRMLQNQINPHFIYNTLNSIKWMATIQHATGIAEMTMALSRLLKSVSKGTERLVPLQAEFALLNDYFTIQHYRYGGTLTLDVTYIEDETLCQACMIPRFTLQPLVENAIFHGIEPKGCAGNIEILVSRDDNGDVLIVLKDDGIGMDPALAEKALAGPDPGEQEEKFQHVGIRNVHRRLQYSFGPGYGLSIASQPGVGTAITVRLPPVPSLYKEVPHDESISCG